MSDGQGGAGDAGAGAGAGAGGDGGQAGGGGAGGAADLLGGSAGGGQEQQQAGGGDAGAGAGAGDGGDGGQGGGEGASDAFLGQFSGDAGEGETASNRDYVKAKGFKDLDSLTKAYRSLEKSFHDKGLVKVPGEGATPEEIAAFNKALGVPEAPDKYSAPELVDAEGKPLVGSDGQPLAMNGERLALINDLAHKAGISDRALKTVLDGIARADFEEMQASEADLSRQAQEHAKGWGDQRDNKLAAVDNAGKLLGLQRDEMLKLRAALGPARALDVLAGLGARVSEDTMLKGDGQRFAGDGRAAQAELDAMKADPQVAAKVMVKGSPEHTRWNRLQGIVAAGLQAQGADAIS